MRDIRRMLENGERLDDRDISRLALRATAPISDSARQAVLYDRLLVLLRSLDGTRIFDGAEPRMTLEDGLLLLAEIEAAIRPN